MACTNCSSKTNGTPKGCKSNGHCASGGCEKLSVFDWLSNMEMPSSHKEFDVVEIRFKNERKGFYFNQYNLPLMVGDTVTVQAVSGYDIGVITLVGEMVKFQMKKKKEKRTPRELRPVLRKSKQEEIDLWIESKRREHSTMMKAREIAKNLNLEMKISDVEFQADNTKATFFYTAENRVDFRELIKQYAHSFRIKTEMKQIGIRQEAGKVGGIGSCGRELCCSTWLSDFRSVSTSAARYQQLSLNPQKLAGQCGKLKCCLNYELDQYVEAFKKFPNKEVKLKTKKGDAEMLKMDVFKQEITYIIHVEGTVQFVNIPLKKAKDIINKNKKGIIPNSLEDFQIIDLSMDEEPDYENVVGQDDLNRFDDKFKKKRTNRNKNRRKGRNNNNKNSKK